MSTSLEVIWPHQGNRLGATGLLPVRESGISGREVNRPMKERDKNKAPAVTPWKTSWLGEFDSPRFFTRTTLKALVLLAWISITSLARSAALFGVLCLAVYLGYWLFSPESLAELKTKAATELAPNAFGAVLLGLLWHGLVVEAFSLLRKLKKRRKARL